MPKVNVYLSEPLANSVRDLQIPLSVVCQRALENEVEKRESRELGNGYLIYEGLRPLHKCRPPAVDTSQQPWRSGGAEVGFSAKWRCAECRAEWVLGYDGKWSIDFSPLVGAIVDLFRS